MRRKLAGAVLACLVAASSAWADCPEATAVCTLQAEGAKLLLAGQFAEAAERFKASIAVAPTARAYLGYAQALEGLGKLPFAHDTMVTARTLSDAEVQTSKGRDVGVTSRAERIKYKLAQLVAKVGRVRLQLPEGVARERVLSVQRKGEADLEQPFDRAIAVTADHQVLVASLRGGGKVELVVEIAAGEQGLAVIPVPAAHDPEATAAPTERGGSRPTAANSRWTPPPRAAVELGAALVVPNVGSAGEGYAIGGGGALRIARPLAVTASARFIGHPATHYDDPGLDVSATELVGLVGLRTSSIAAMFGTLEAGAVQYTETDRSLASGGIPASMGSYTTIAPVLAAGAGISLGRIDVRANALWVGTTSEDLHIPLRFQLAVSYRIVSRP